jgi:hypothetical protein
MTCEGSGAIEEEEGEKRLDCVGAALADTSGDLTLGVLGPRSSGEPKHEILQIEKKRRAKQI